MSGGIKEVKELHSSHIHADSEEYNHEVLRWIKRIESLPLDQRLKYQSNAGKSQVLNKFVCLLIRSELQLKVFVRIESIKLFQNIPDRDVSLRVQVNNESKECCTPSNRYVFNEVEVCLNLYRRTSNGPLVKDALFSKARGFLNRFHRRSPPNIESERESISDSMISASEFDNISIHPHHEEVKKLSEEFVGYCIFQMNPVVSAVSGKYFIIDADDTERVVGEISVQMGLLYDGMDLPSATRSTMDIADQHDCLEGSFSVYIANPKRASIWKRYRIILKGNQLHLFANTLQKSEESKGSIELSRLTAVGIADPDRVCLPNCILLKIADVGKLYLRADDQESRDKWIDALSKHKQTK